MSKRILFTADAPSDLAPHAVRTIAQAPDADGWCIVVPRAYLLHSLSADLLQARSGRGWIGERILTVDRLLDHFGREAGDRPTLTPIQARQIIAAIVREVHAASEGAAFPGQVPNGRPARSLVRSLISLFEDLGPMGHSTSDLEASLGGDDAPRERVARARGIAAVYRTYHQRLRENGLLPPDGDRASAALLASQMEPPSGLHRFAFLGIDGSSLQNAEIQLAFSLAQNSAVQEMRLYAALPETPSEEAWSTHANLPIFEQWLKKGYSRVHIAPGTSTLAADLAAMHQGPFDFRADPPSVTGAIELRRFPDAASESEWIARDVKKRILSGTDPASIAVVGRDMADRAPTLVRTMSEMGVPVVASHERPLSAVAAVRASMLPYRLLAEEWSPSDLIALADSPYHDFPLSPRILTRAAEGSAARTRSAWLRRLRSLAHADRLNVDDPPAPARPSRVTAEQIAEFERFLTRLTDTLGPSAHRTPAEWVSSLVSLIERSRLEDRIYALRSGEIDEQALRIAREDLDGMNTLVRAAHEWARGAELAGTSKAQLSVEEWSQEVEELSETATIRVSTYPRSAVQLLEAPQAALRSWEVVYLAGLSDGVFPLRLPPEAHGLTDEDRRTLSLPDAAQRSARERLLFHLAAASCRSQLLLSAPSADDRGKALVTSPFLSSLPLRVAGLSIRDVQARSLTPASERDALSPADLDALASRRYRQMEKEPGFDPTADPILAPWLSVPSHRHAVRGWGVSRARAEIEQYVVRTAAPRLEMGRFLGDISPTAVQSPVADAFSPSELESYQKCHFRHFGEHVLGLRAAEGHASNEAASFGVLQHRVLEEVYGSLIKDELLPPANNGVLPEAFARLKRAAARHAAELAETGHEGLWRLDLEFTLRTLRGFVRRDLARMVASRTMATHPSVRTELVALEEVIGPVDVEGGQTRFRLKGKLDRVERVADPRLPDDVQGQLVIRDYKGSTSSRSPALKKYLSGESLQLPLYAALARAHYGVDVLGFGELRPAASSDPMPVQNLALEVEEGESRWVAQTENERPVVQAAVHAALRQAGKLVEGIRAGYFVPQKQRSCRGCPLQNVCRAATGGATNYEPSRPTLPLSLSVERATPNSNEPTR